MPAVTKSRKETSSQAALPTTDGTSIIFGITFDLNGTVIPVSAGEVSTWKKKGVKLKLPHEVEVGSIEGALNYLEGWLGVSIPKAGEMPEPIKAVIEGITSMVITVYQAEIEIPGEESTEKKNKYLIEVGGTSQKGIPLIPGTKILMIQGLVVGATNKAQAAPTPAL